MVAKVTASQAGIANTENLETSQASFGIQILKNGQQVAESVSGFSRAEINKIQKRFWEKPIDYSCSSFSKYELATLNVRFNTGSWGDHNILENLPRKVM